MDVEELLERAWNAVEKADLPEHVQGVALKEAIAFLREGDGGEDAPKQRRGRPPRRRAGAKPPAGEESPTREIPDEATFFADLASESGVAERELRDVLQLTTAGTVHVTAPARLLGTSTTQQAKRVIALVAGARSFGLGESPVDAEAVRAEARRRRCFDPNNFAGKALGPLTGFNAGSNRSEIVTTSKWVGEFKDAVEAARGAEVGDNED